MLEIGHALNVSNFFGFIFNVYPNTDQAYDKTAMYDVFDSTSAVDSYYNVRNFLAHTFPMIATIYMILTTKAIFLQTDWDLMINTAVAYLFTSRAYAMWTGVNKVYIIDWETYDKYFAF